VPGHRLSRSLAPLACHLTRRFQQIQRIEPAVERALVQPMEATILGASHTASTPRLQVSRPPCPSCFVFEVSCPHPEILPCAKDPDIVRQCTTEQMCETRTLTTDRKRLAAAHASDIDSFCRLPIPRQQFIEPIDRMPVDHALEHIMQ